MPTASDIEIARSRLHGALVETPCTPSPMFGEMIGGHVYFKFENLQRTGSFKERGALNRILAIDPDERARGVVAASAGNHAQGVAFHASRLGIPATIVMPERTPLVKVASTRSYGAAVVLHGSVYDEAMEEALRLRDEHGATLVHPFDDPVVIAGQATIGAEIIEQVPETGVVVVPVGGGGLIGGIAAAVKSARPGVRVVGVESEAMSAARESRAAGARVVVDRKDTIAEGISVRQIGEHTFDLIERYVDDLVTVSEEEIANAILLLLEREKTVVEGAGAATLAALLNDRIGGIDREHVVLVLSGGNIDVTLLSRIIDRGLLQDGRMAVLRLRVPDRPGSLATLTRLVAGMQANIVELEHRRRAGEVWITEAEVVLTLETRGPEHVGEVIAALDRSGFVVLSGP